MAASEARMSLHFHLHVEDEDTSALQFQVMVDKGDRFSDILLRVVQLLDVTCDLDEWAHLRHRISGETVQLRRSQRVKEEGPVEVAAIDALYHQLLINSSPIELNAALTSLHWTAATDCLFILVRAGPHPCKAATAPANPEIKPESQSTIKAEKKHKQAAKPTQTPQPSARPSFDGDDSMSAFSVTDLERPASRPTTQPRSLIRSSHISHPSHSQRRSSKAKKRARTEHKSNCENRKRRKVMAAPKKTLLRGTNAPRARKAEHLIIALDSSSSMGTPLVNYTRNKHIKDARPPDRADDHGITCYKMSLDYIKKYVQQVWAKERSTLSLATFGSRLEMIASMMEWSVPNVKTLMKLIIKSKQAELSSESALYCSLLCLLEGIEKQADAYSMTRILLFTDGANSAARPYEQVAKLIRTNRITLDVIHATRSERDDVSLRNLCHKVSHHGMYWNPMTMQEWKDIYDSGGFLKPHQRSSVVDITNDSD